MKKIFLFSILTSLLFACENSVEKQSKQMVSDLSNFVDSVSKITPVYENSFWKNIQSEYEKKEAKAEAVKANLDGAALKEIEDTKAKFTAFRDRYKEEKVTYETKLAENKKAKILSTLFGDNNSSGTAFAWVTSANIAEVYKKFVDAVDANQNNYSESDWQYIKNVFKSLDARRDEISKEISGKDKLKISGEKIRFGAMKAIG